ncbi:unnamed protein product [Coccothraustes coccothraustes]
MASRQGTPNRDAAPGVSPVLSLRAGGRPCWERDSSPGCGRSGTPGNVTPRVCRGPAGAGWAGGGRSRAANRHSAPSPPPAASPGRASGQRLTNPSSLASGTPHSSSQEPLASGTPHRSPQEALASGAPIPRLRNLLPQEPLISLLRKPSPREHAIPRRRNPSPRLPLRKGSFGARGMGRSRCPLTFVQVRDLPAAEVPCQPRKEGKIYRSVNLREEREGCWSQLEKGGCREKEPFECWGKGRQRMGYSRRSEDTHLP